MTHTVDDYLIAAALARLARERDIQRHGKGCPHSERTAGLIRDAASIYSHLSHSERTACIQALTIPTPPPRKP